MKIYIEDFELIDSGLIQLTGDQPITFKPFPEEYSICVTFAMNTVNTGSAINHRAISPNKFSVELVNFRNGLWIANTDPIHVANNNNRKVFLNIASSVTGRGRFVSYTFYYGDPPNV